jgi:hypothetical protein
MRLVRTLAALAALALAARPAHATTFTLGEFVSYSQGSWGQDPACNQFGCNAAAVLENNFDSVFARFNGLMEVGIPGPAGFSIIFDGPDPIITYLPASGTPGPLTADLLDPVTSASGGLGGEVVTAELNVAFSDAGVLAHPHGVPFGDLVLQNLESLVGSPGFGPEIAQLDGAPVHELLSEANLLLGGAASPFTPEEMFVLLDGVDFSFAEGVILSSGAEIDGLPDTFAMEHLAFPGTAPTVPEPSTWAMLIIGFAGLGFVRYRASRKSNAVAGSSGSAQGRG